MNGQTGRFILADDTDVVMRPADVAKLVTERGWTLDRTGEYLGCSGSHVGAFLRRNGYRPAPKWVGGRDTVLGPNRDTVLGPDEGADSPVLGPEEGKGQ